MLGRHHFNEAIGLAAHALNDALSETERVVDALSEKLNAGSKAVKLTYPNGDHYHGEACAGTRHGYGVYQHGDQTGRYEGEYVDNEKYGSGACFFADGDIYDGQWCRDKQHGRGAMVHWSPEAGVWVYEGEFCDGQRSGSGALLARERGALIGSWSGGGLQAGVEFRFQADAHSPAEILAIGGATVLQADGESGIAATDGGARFGSSPNAWTLKEVSLWFQSLGFGALPDRTLSPLMGERLLSMVDTDYRNLSSQCEDAEGSQAWCRMLSLASATLRHVGREDARVLHTWEDVQTAIPSVTKRLIPAAELAADAAQDKRPVQLCEWRGMSVELYSLPLCFGAAGGGGDAVTANHVCSWAKDLEALATVRHPNMRALLGVTLLPSAGDPSGSMLTIVYESCQKSKLLFEWIHAMLPDGSRQALNFKTELRLCIGICDALSSLSQKGLVCSALTSVNVEVVPDGYDGMQPKARLLRVGASWWRWGWRRSLRMRDAGQPRPRALSMDDIVAKYGLCPVNWLAPEVLRGDCSTQASDVYSFGLVLWEMLYRAVPFGEFSIAQIIGAVGYGRRKLQVAASPGASAETSFLHEVVGCCIRRDPEKRPRAAVLLESLRDMLQTHEQRRAKKSALSKLGDKTEKFIAKRVLSDGLQRSLYGSDLAGGGKAKKGAVAEGDEGEGARMVRLDTGEWVRVDMDLVQQYPGDEAKWRMLMGLRARLAS